MTLRRCKKYAASKGWAKFVDYKEIDKPPEEKVRGIAINATHLEFETEDRAIEIDGETIVVYPAQVVIIRRTRIAPRFFNNWTQRSISGGPIGALQREHNASIFGSSASAHASRIHYHHCL